LPSCTDAQQPAAVRDARRSWARRVIDFLARRAGHDSLAAAAGVDKSRVSDWRTGKREPGLSVARTLCQDPDTAPLWMDEQAAAVNAAGAWAVRLMMRRAQKRERELTRLEVLEASRRWIDRHGLGRAVDQEVGEELGVEPEDVLSALAAQGAR
jgi:hypothetical protein